MTTPHPALVLLSGGVDSTVLLHYAVRRLGAAPVLALSFDYGQRHARELDCARRQAAAAGAAHRVIELPFLGGLLRGASALIAGGPAVPALEALAAAERDQPPTYVPNRNMMLLAMAAACAEAQGMADVYYGAQAQDEYGYWDCTRPFLERLNAALELNRRTPVRIHAPFIEKPKRDTVRLGLELGVDFAQTWSCYRGQDTACGECPTCIERLDAFAANHSPDPLPYALRRC